MRRLPAVGAGAGAFGPSLVALLAASSLALGCTVGEGEGWVRSDRLYIEDCWNGTFDLGPDFFGANSFRAESLLIRVQRGDNIEELSDGLTVVVNDLPAQRASVGTPLEVGMPVGVHPPGVPIVYDPDPPPVSLALYLHNSCHVQNGTVYSIEGNITFSSLFSGDPDEKDTDDRLTEANFDATFADPRLLVGDGAADPTFRSHVTGYFRFFSNAASPLSRFSEMITRVDQRLRSEARAKALRFGCEDCAHFAPELGTCANGYPAEPHRGIDLEAVAALEFCKEFELV